MLTCPFGCGGKEANMPQARTRADSNSPEAIALAEEMRKGAYTREGTMVAFPTCFPGATAPIVLDESRITALDIPPAGAIYGGTSGRQAHLFVASTHGITGIVFDIGRSEEHTSELQSL